MYEFRPPQHRTTVTIDKPDWEYMQKHGLKASHLIRAMIRDHRAFTEEGEAETTLQMRKKLESITKILQRYTKFLEKEGLSDKFLKEQGLI